MGSLEYAQARLSARYGERPDEIAWRRIEHLRELPALLDAARISAFGIWLAGIDPIEHAAPDRMHPARPLAHPGGGGGSVDAGRMAARDTLVRGRRRPASGRAPRARRGRSAMDAGRRGLPRPLRARVRIWNGAGRGIVRAVARGMGGARQARQRLARRVAAAPAGAPRRRRHVARRARARAASAPFAPSAIRRYATAGRCAARWRRGSRCCSAGRCSIPPPHSSFLH